MRGPIWDFPLKYVNWNINFMIDVNTKFAPTKIYRKPPITQNGAEGTYFLGQRVLCALFWNFNSLPSLPLYPLESKFQNKTRTEPCMPKKRGVLLWHEQCDTHIGLLVLSSNLGPMISKMCHKLKFIISLPLNTFTTFSGMILPKHFHIFPYKM